MYFISSSVIIKLLGSCINCGLLTVFKWQVIKDDGSLLDLDVFTTTTGGSKANLVLRRNVLENNRTYVFELEVSTFLHGATGFAKLILDPILPPYGGSCSLDYQKGVVVALEDRRTIECREWLDNIPTNDPLQYHIFVVDPTSTNNPQGQSWYPIYKGTQPKTSFYLSPFGLEKGYVDLFVLIVDSVGTRAVALEK